MKLVDKFQRPDNLLGKSLRDAVLSSIGIGLVALIKQLDAVDFGQFDQLVHAFALVVMPLINRLTRKPKQFNPPKPKQFNPQIQNERRY